MSTFDHYVIRMRDTSYAVVGPFESQDAAADWGRRDQEHGDDDPRWQVIQLADPHAVRAVRPDWTPAVADRPRDTPVSPDDLAAIEALFDALWAWKRSPAGRADTPDAERLRAAFARAERTDVAQDNFIPF